MRVESGIESEIAWSGNPGLFVNRKMRTIEEFGEYVRKIAGLNNVPGVSYYRDNKFAINSEGQEHLRNLGYHPYVQAALSMYRAGITPSGYHEEESVFKNSRARRKAEREKERAAEILRVDKSQLPEVNSASGIIQGLIEIATQDVMYPIFDPYSLTPMASIDKIRFSSVAEEEVIGRDLLLRSELLSVLIGRYAIELGIEVKGKYGPELPEVLDNIFNSRSKRKKQIASSIAKTYGTALGKVISELTRLHLPLISPMWQKQYADFWAGIHSVVLTGELMSGRFGQTVLQSARQVVNPFDLDIEFHHNPSLATLIGAARSAPITIDRPVSILDFGKEEVKRGFATGGSSLEELHLLHPYSFLGDSWPRSPQALLNLMTNVIEETIRETSRAKLMIICLPTYIKNGHPISQHFGGDIFSRLGELQVNLTDWLNQLTGIGGAEIVLIGSDSAAARSVAGKRHAVVLSLGERVGVGFIPPSEGLAPLSADFSISTSDVE